MSKIKGKIRIMVEKLLEKLEAILEYEKLNEDAAEELQNAVYSLKDLEEEMEELIESFEQKDQHLAELTSKGYVNIAVDNLREIVIAEDVAELISRTEYDKMEALIAAYDLF